MSGTVDMKLEVVVIPVSDVDRAKRFYQGLGWREDVDIAGPHGYRAVHLTPPGSSASILIGNKGVTPAVPGSIAGLLLAVHDIGAARAELISQGVDVSEVFHDAGGSLGGGFIAASKARAPGTRPPAAFLRLVRVVQRPGRKRLAAAGGHHPAPRSG